MCPYEAYATPDEERDPYAEMLRMWDEMQERLRGAAAPPGRNRREWALAYCLGFPDPNIATLAGEGRFRLSLVFTHGLILPAGYSTALQAGYDILWQALEQPENARTRQQLEHQPLIDTGRTVNTELHPGLMRLALAFVRDLQEATCWFHNRGHLWPDPPVFIAVDSAIVKRVIAGTQVVLDRESHRLQTLAYPLAELPIDRQERLVRWRRYRAMQFGITQEDWAQGTWSVYNVPEEDEWP